MGILKYRAWGETIIWGMNLFEPETLFLRKRHLRYSLKGEDEDLAELKEGAKEPALGERKGTEWCEGTSLRFKARITPPPQGLPLESSKTDTALFPWTRPWPLLTVLCQFMLPPGWLSSTIWSLCWYITLWVTQHSSQFTFSLLQSELFIQ